MNTLESQTERQEPDYRTPEQHQAAVGEGVPGAYEMPLEDINPVNAHLFKENRWCEVFKRLREEDPVHFNEIPSAGRYWSITKYEDVKKVDQDWESFSSAHGINIGFPVGMEPPTVVQGSSPPFIAQDPPSHDEQRRTVAGVSAPQNLANLEPLIRERTCRVLDSLPLGETFNWVDSVSIELTTMMLATLFDFPFEDRHKLTYWSDAAFAIPEPGGIIETPEEKGQVFRELVTYFSDLWEERRKKPGDDLVSMLVHGEATKDMPVVAHLGNLVLLIVGGNDTTRNTMSGSVFSLNQFPEQYEKLTQRQELIPQMVAEVIRWQTPLSYMRRTATKDYELRGKLIRKNDQVLMWYVSGNRDEEIFSNADVLDIERTNARQHLSFGFGIHRCMGNRLAELQLRILWEEILPRFRRVEVVGEPTYTFSSFVKGYTNLPVTLKPH